MAALLFGLGLVVSGVVFGAEPPPGASSCSGCHPASNRVDTPVPRLRGHHPEEIVAAMQAFRSGERPSTVMGRIAKDFPTMRSGRSQPGSVRKTSWTAVATTRRAFLGGATAAFFPAPALSQDRTRIVVIGGGFAGATCARELRRAEPRAAVTLIEADPSYTACPFSNSVIAGLRPIDAQRFSYDALRAEGISIRQDTAKAIDPVRQLVT
jgi:FAD dependent oxidoreductase